MEIAIQSEVAFQKETERKLFYKNFNKHDEGERSSHNRRKAPTIYCAPKYHNIISIHLMSALSSAPDPKYITTGCQQHFFPIIGEYLVYKPHRDFSAYLYDSGRISAFQKNKLQYTH